MNVIEYRALDVLFGLMEFEFQDFGISRINVVKFPDRDIVKRIPQDQHECSFNSYLFIIRKHNVVFHFLFD